MTVAMDTVSKNYKNISGNTSMIKLLGHRCCQKKNEQYYNLINEFKKYQKFLLF